MLQIMSKIVVPVWNVLSIYGMWKISRLTQQVEVWENIEKTRMRNGVIPRRRLTFRFYVPGPACAPSHTSQKNTELMVKRRSSNLTYEYEAL